VIVPKKVIEDVFGAFSQETEASKDKPAYSRRIKELTVERLNNLQGPLRNFPKLSARFPKPK